MEKLRLIKWILFWVLWLCVWITTALNSVSGGQHDEWHVAESQHQLWECVLKWLEDGNFLFLWPFAEHKLSASAAAQTSVYCSTSPDEVCRLLTPLLIVSGWEVLHVCVYCFTFLWFAKKSPTGGLQRWSCANVFGLFYLVWYENVSIVAALEKQIIV